MTPVDTSRLHAAVDQHTKAADELRSTCVKLAAQNHELIAKLEAAYAADPAAADHVEVTSANDQAQRQVDDLAAKLDASARAMSDTAAANQPGTVPAAPAKPATSEAKAA